MIIASSTSSRHLQSLSENLIIQFKKCGVDNCKIEGYESTDWKLVDAIDIIVHLFHPEKDPFMIWKKCGLRICRERGFNMMKILYYLIFLFALLTGKVYSNTTNELYEKIDLFGEVLEKIKEEYVDDIDQADVMDQQLTVFCNLWTLTQHICLLNFSKACRPDLKGSLVDWVLRLVWKQVL